MKHWLLCSVVFLAVSGTVLSAQESIEENDAGQSGNSLPAFAPSALIVRTRALGPYGLQDGTSLNRRDLRARLLTVPENRAVLRRADGWRIASWATGVVMTGAAVTTLVYALNPDLPNARDIMSVCGSVDGLMTVMELLFWNLSDKTTSMAVQNYNLSIMGLPVPLGRK
jgi:hypothetical protein